jgi:uncharacterized damage-inducible protein DinB
MSTTPAINATGPITVTFSFNEPFVEQALDGLSHEELWRAPTSHNNPILWVAGHVVQTRTTVLQMIGQSVDTGWGTLFDRGAKIGDRSQYPSATEVARVMCEVSPKLRGALAAITEAELMRPASLPIPGINTLMDELAFFALHESYHVGQLAYIRKSLGYPGLAG